MTRYYSIDWDALDALPPAERMAALADINTEIRTVTGRERARMAAAAVEEHGTQAAAAKALGMKPARFSQIYREHAMNEDRVGYPICRTATYRSQGQLVTREWTQTIRDGYWHTTHDGRDWVLHYESRGLGKGVWSCGPWGGPAEETFEFTTVPSSGPLEEASWLLDRPQRRRHTAQPADH